VLMWLSWKTVLAVYQIVSHLNDCSDFRTPVNCTIHSSAYFKAVAWFLSTLAEKYVTKSSDLLYTNQSGSVHRPMIRELDS